VPELSPCTGLLYGEQPNVSLLQFVGALRGRILDLGCGAGAWAELLRNVGGRELIGVDISAEACDAARPHYDAVLNSQIEEIDLEALGGEQFDVIVVADVLEHLYDPWRVLGSLRHWIKNEGQLVISTPNARYYKFWMRLAFFGDFLYDDAGGFMDKSHIRWFTKRSLTSAMNERGWEAVKWGGAWDRKRRVIGSLTHGIANQFLWHQLYVIAVPERSTAIASTE
jgi:2-polyprenyl-3-methyl-5-hydroxy-6-metoxy-1,4-benzoquinol methylase